jgi:hypothetical protein
MIFPTLDHIISFYAKDDIESHLSEYLDSGFNVTDEKVKHPYGKENRFINFGLTYIEFFWVEDKKLFNTKSSNREKYFRNHPKTFGIGFAANKLASFEKYLKSTYSNIPNLFTRGPSDKPSEISWEFILQKQKHLHGFYSFCLSYFKRDPNKPRKLKVSKNSIYAISGITLVSKNLKNDLENYSCFF